MLPADLLSWTLVRHDGHHQVLPDYLTPADHPWLRDLIALVESHVGRRQRTLLARLKEPLVRDAPPRRVRMAAHVLARLSRGDRPEVAIEPRRARREVFRGACDPGGTRDTVMATVAASLSVDASALEASLFADLPGERRVAPLDPVPSADALALRTNLGLAQGLLKRAGEVTLQLRGNARDVVRYAQLRGLICVPTRTPDGVQLQISGPFALFRRTTLYGRAQAELVPRLPWCEHFALRATCHLRDSEGVLQLGPGDPVFPSLPPRRFDSKLEARFARDLARSHPDWHLIREPVPLVAGDRLIFPDFALCHRDRPQRRWLVELVGFWTPSYLRDKLQRLARTGARDLILCVDRTLDCSDAELPPDLPVVWFRRRVDPADVLAVIEGLEPPHPGDVATPDAHLLDLPCLFLDWAGRRPATDAVHDRLAALQPGDPVRLVSSQRRVQVTTPDGHTLATLSALGHRRWAPRLEQIVACTVQRVEVRRREQSAPRYRPLLAVPRWRVPVVQVHLQPAAESRSTTEPYRIGATTSPPECPSTRSAATSSR